MRFYKSILIFVVLLSGCANPQYANCLFNKIEIQDKKMSMIVTKLRAYSIDEFNKKGNLNAGFIVIQMVNNNKYNYLVYGDSYSSSITMIKPGRYTIVQYGWEDGVFKYIYSTDKAGIFTVSPGECVYLGDVLLVRRPGKPISISVKNNSKIALAEINQSKASGLITKMEFVSILKQKEGVEI